MKWINAGSKDMWDQIGYVPAELSPIVGELIGSGEWAIEELYVRNLDTSPEWDAPRLIVRIEGKDLRESEK